MEDGLFGMCRVRGAIVFTWVALVAAEVRIHWCCVFCCGGWGDCGERVRVFVLELTLCHFLGDLGLKRDKFVTVKTEKTWFGRWRRLKKEMWSDLSIFLPNHIPTRLDC